MFVRLRPMTIRESDIKLMTVSSSASAIAFERGHAIITQIKITLLHFLGLPKATNLSSLLSFNNMTEPLAIETTPLKDSTAYRPDDELPTNVETTQQLKLLPEECLSGDEQRPLRHVDDQGNVYFYSLKPMQYSVVLILMVELLERFSFYGE